MASNSNKSYLDRGFNGFLRRTIASDPTARTLSQMARNAGRGNSLNFDTMQVSGSLGDTLEVGKILIDGATGDGRLDGHDDSGNTVWRLGDLEG